MQRGRVLVLLALLAVAALAVAQEPQNPDGSTSVTGSECFRCHEQGGGGFGPPFRNNVVMVPDRDTEFPVDGPVPYTVNVRNGWTAAVYDMVATLDLEDAPSFGFSPGIDPVHETRSATLATAAGTGERTVRDTFEVPAGVTDLRIRLVPEPVQPEVAPDLVLRVWPANVEPDSVPPLESDQGSNGAVETVHLRGAQELAARGAGTWTVEAAQSVEGDVPFSLMDQDLRFELDAWANVTGELRKPLSSDVRFGGDAEDGGPPEAAFTWNLVAVEAPSQNETFRLTVESTGHYDHPGSVSEGWDTWRFTESIDFRTDGTLVGPHRGPGGDGPGAPGGPPGPGTTGPDPVPAAAVPWDRISEIVGYVSAFLLAFSMVSGGVFGKKSRRGLNRVFRTAKRRVAFHNLLSYLLTLAAAVHTGLFIWEPGFHWTLGLIWGGGALLAMFLLGITGAFQVPMIRALDFGTWRWTHFWLGIAAVVLTVAHILLDGIHFTDVQEAVGWQDPFAQARRAS